MKTRYVYVAHATLVAILIASPIAQAAEPSASGDRLDEIIVTARRVEENLQDVPLAITALGAEDLRRQSILQIQDLARVTPGLTVQATSRGGNQPAYTIRGQRGVNVPTILTDPAVAIYFAEVNQSRSNGTTQAMFDLASVQVLKGPQGTLFGRNSTGGAILIEPNRPQLDAFGGYLQGSLGNYDFMDLEGVLNAPLSKNVALRLAGKITERDGWFRNRITRQSANDLDNQSYRASLLVETGDLKSNTIGTYYSYNGVGSAVKMTDFDERGFPRTFPARPALVATLNADAAQNRALGRYEHRSPVRLYTQERTRSVQNNAEFMLTDQLTLKNVLGWRDLRAEYANDFIGAGVRVAQLPTAIRMSQVTEELQLQGRFGALDFVAGAFYFRERGRETTRAQQFTFIGQVIPALAVAFPIQQTNDYSTTSRSYAAFAHADYDVGSGLSISGGLRYTRDEKSIRYYNTNASGVNPATFSCTLVPITRPIVGGQYSGRDNDMCLLTPPSLKTGKLTYDASVNWRVSDQALLYLAHRHGYRAGGFNLSPPADGTARTYDPETVHDVELGSKLDFDVGATAVRFNAAAYYQKYKDIQRTQTIFITLGGGTTTSNQTVNAASAHVWGGEAELSVRPSRQLRFSGSYAYTKGTYDDWIQLYSVGGVPTGVDVSDSQFAFVPKHQFSLSATVTPDVPEEIGKPSFTVTWYGQSKTASADLNGKDCGSDGLFPACINRFYGVAGYDLVNGRFDWEKVGGSRLDLSFFVTNLLNRYYVAFAIPPGNLGAMSILPGQPRMFGFQLRVPFGDE